MTSYPIASIVSAFIIGVLISGIVLLVYGVYIFLATGHYFDLAIVLKTIGLIFVSSLMNATLMGFIVSSVSTNSAFSAISLIIGSSIGFLNGMYIPIGQLGESTQKVLKLLPFSHIASLFRQVLMKQSIDVTFSGAPQESIDNYKNVLGVVLDWNVKKIPLNQSFLFILAVFLISLVLFFINFKRKKEVI